MAEQIIIIGSGFSGLSAAAMLAKQGLDVTILEKNATPGGRARKYSEEGFTFDMGPSWYWLPDVFDDYFKIFNKKTSDFYDLKRLDPSYKVFYSDNESYNIPASIDGIYSFFDKMEAGSSRKLDAFLKEAEYKYEVGVKNLVYKPSKSIFEFMNWDVMKGMFKLHILKSFEKYVKQNFKNEKLHPLLYFPIIFLGSTPARTPALYNLMNYADMKLGTWYPMGGMFEVVKAFVDIAEQNGVKIHYNQEVTGFDISNGTIKGVKTKDNVFKADRVIGSADYHHIEQNLLNPDYRVYSEKYWDSREMAPSSLLFYIGLDKEIDGLEHHNLMFDEDFYVHAQEIFEDKIWPSKPLLYISATTKTDKSVAPEGKENIVALIPVSPGLEDTDETREKFYKLIIDRMEKLTGQEIGKHVIYKRSYAHRDFEKDYHAYKGNAYGLGNTLKQTAFLKPKIKSKKVSNLFYAGQLTTPGPGVPPSIISGQVAANEVLKTLNK
jgi:phytoene desaturase